ncbi:MAG TPA: hypothetical protein VFE82_08400 [Ramlibacter sp.]|jgi:hypothetical protein|uniref:hypothetical protein n=1 Tax=Ramlibacter sp. TaxID=1917967 RepID=UPI002D220160|nr:hypothetical protein [Ramlibacter sp.]HZY18488.1 hypothetical protein [Ramlibacter sp.]
MQAAAIFPEPPTLPPTRTGAAHRGPAEAEHAIHVVLTMLSEHMGMDVVFVRQFTEGARRFRVVDALGHGPAAALATGQPAGAGGTGRLLEVNVLLRDGQLHGTLCAFCPEGEVSQAERHVRLLQHGARLAARLLDNEKVLRELARLNH